MILNNFNEKISALKHAPKAIDINDINSKFEKYFNLLVEENGKYNLTAITEKEEVYLKHFYDSLYILNYFCLDKLNILDIGSGAGFPGIPLAIICKNSTFYLCEPTTKRANFLQMVIDSLGLKNVKVINKRAEELDKNYREFFDVVTSRAVSALNIILELSVPFVKVNSWFIPFKGNTGKEEIQNAKNAIKALKVTLERVEEYEIDENLCRTLIFFKKSAKTAHKYPRNYSLIKSKTL